MTLSNTFEICEVRHKGLKLAGSVLSLQGFLAGIVSPSFSLLGTMPLLNDLFHKKASGKLMAFAHLVKMMPEMPSGPEDSFGVISLMAFSISFSSTQMSEIMLIESLFS